MGLFGVFSRNDSNDPTIRTGSVFIGTGIVRIGS